MNQLETFIKTTGMSETEAMNHLQDQGAVSDNCITAADVAEADQQRAVNRLMDTVKL